MSLDSLAPLLQGAIVTIHVTILSFLLAIAVSLVSGMAALSSSHLLRAVNTVYVTVFRGTSAIVQAFFIFFVLPGLGLRLSPMTAAVLTLGLNFGAYGSEIVRATVTGVGKGQYEAATALGMGRLLTFRRIVLPQALIPMLPLFGNELVVLIKATPILSAVTVTELTYEAKEIIKRTGDSTSVYTLLLFAYFAIVFPITLAMRRIERWVARRYGSLPGYIR